MFTTKIIATLSAIFFVAFLSTHTAHASLQYGQFKVQPSNTKIQFEVVNLLISTARGSFSDFSGNVNINKNFTTSKFNAVIQTNSIQTGEGMRDDHLKEEDFFHVEKFPTITFDSQEVTGTPEDFIITGLLKILSVQKSIKLNAQYNEVQKTITAKGAINRTDFGLNNGPTIKNKVDLIITYQFE